MIRPDRLVFDLAPPGDDFEIVRWTARQLQDLLTGLGLTPAVMTTGSRGLHLLVLLDRAPTSTPHALSPAAPPACWPPATPTD